MLENVQSRCWAQAHPSFTLTFSMALSSIDDLCFEKQPFNVDFDY
jgi:hypothetical protein